MAQRGISPAANNGADLGSESKVWRKVYANAADDAMSLGNNYSIGYRKPSTEYAVGKAVKTTQIGRERFLVCVKAGTSSSGDLSAGTTLEGQLIYDGSVVWAITTLPVPGTSAEEHNSLFRGADITDYFESGLMTDNIQANKYYNIYPGDFIQKTITIPALEFEDSSGTTVTQEAVTIENAIWNVGGILTHAQYGSPSTGTPHVLLISKNILLNYVKMNATETTDGGFVGSDMWQHQLPNIATAVKNAFGSNHVLNHTEQLTNAVVDGKATSAIWQNVDVNIPSETMVYGCNVYSGPYDVSDFPMQLPFFAIRNHVIDVGSSREGYWLRNVANAGDFCEVAQTAGASYRKANTSSQYIGIRPYFLLY